MTGLDRWLEILKVVVTLISSITTLCAFWKQVTAASVRKRRKKQKSPHRSTR